MGFLCSSEAASSSDGIRIELAGGGDSGAFAVHADTGTISRMPTPLDYESLARLQNDTTPTLCLTCPAGVNQRSPARARWRSRRAT